MTKKRRGTRRARHAAHESVVERSSRRRAILGRTVLGVAVVLAVVGTTVVGLYSQDRRSGEFRSAQHTESTPTAASSTPQVRGPVLKRSKPLALRVKSIGLTSPLLALGLRQDGTVEPPPPKKADTAGWYQASPTPGEAGPSVIVGYQDRTKGMPAPVFGDLGKVGKGDRVEVRRSDKTVAVFRVDRVARYSARRFPADEVYGSVDHAALRLITATAPSNTPATAGPKNVVVYASLLRSRAAA